MYIFLTILIIVVCVLLGAVVLIQNPKGGGLSASFGGVGQQLLGARRSTDVVEKATWGFAIGLLFLCLTTSFFIDKKATTKTEKLPSSEIEEMQKSKPIAPFQTNPAPTQQPNQQPNQQPAQPQQQP